MNGNKHIATAQRGASGKDRTTWSSQRKFTQKQLYVIPKALVTELFNAIVQELAWYIYKYLRCLRIVKPTPLRGNPCRLPGKLNRLTVALRWATVNYYTGTVSHRRPALWLFVALSVLFCSCSCDCFLRRTCMSQRASQSFKGVIGVPPAMCLVVWWLFMFD